MGREESKTSKFSFLRFLRSLWRNRNEFVPFSETFSWFCGAYLIILGASFLILPQGRIGIWLQPIWLYAALMAAAGLLVLWSNVLSLSRNKALILSAVIAMLIMTVAIAYVQTGAVGPAAMLGLLSGGVFVRPFLRPASATERYRPDLLGLILGAVAAASGLEFLTRPASVAALSAQLGVSTDIIGHLFLWSGIAVVISQTAASLSRLLLMVACLVCGLTILGLYAVAAVYVDPLYWILGAAAFIRGGAMIMLPWWGRRIVEFDAYALRPRLALALGTAAIVPVLTAVTVLLYTLDERLIANMAARPFIFGMTLLLVVGSGLFGWELAGRLTAPLSALMYSVKQIAGGQHGLALSQQGTTEIVSLSTEIERMARTLEIQAAQNKSLYEVERRTHAEAVLVAERLAQLQAITAALSESLTQTQIATYIVNQTLTMLGAVAGAVLVVSDDATTLKIIADNGYGTSNAIPIRELPLAANGSITEAVRTKQAIWLESKAERDGRFPAEAAFDATRNAWVILPLVEGVGDQAIGALGFSFIDARSFGETERRLALSLAHQCAQALERARLYEKEVVARADAERALTRIAQLQQMAAALSQLRPPAEIAQVIVTRGMVGIGASAGAVNLYNAANQTFEVIYSSNWTKLTSAWQEFPADPELPVTVVVLNKQPLWGETFAAMVAQFPRMASFKGSFPNAWAMLPLVVNQKALGVVSFSWPIKRTFNDEDKSFVLALADQAAQALERAQLYSQVQAQAAHLEEQVMQRTQELQQAVQRAQFAEHLTKMMLSNVTHEMRTPLSSILGFSDLILSRQPQGKKLEEYVTIINTEGKRLLQLIVDFLDLQRFERGMQAVHYESVDLAALIETLVLAQPVNQMSRYVIRLDLSTVPPVSVDKARIEQVLLNLLSNAIKYSPWGGDIVISLRLAEVDQEVIVAVRDHGLGIPGEELGRLFERFFRGETAERSRIQGTGLGLALSKEIVQLHQGRIWAESAGTGHGTTFYVALPIIRAAEKHFHD